MKPNKPPSEKKRLDRLLRRHRSAASRLEALDPAGVVCRSCGHRHPHDMVPDQCLACEEPASQFDREQVVLLLPTDEVPHDDPALSEIAVKLGANMVITPGPQGLFGSRWHQRAYAAGHDITKPVLFRWTYPPEPEPDPLAELERLTAAQEQITADLQRLRARMLVVPSPPK